MKRQKNIFQYVSYLIIKLLYFALFPFIWIMSMFSYKRVIKNTINYVFFFHPEFANYATAQAQFETADFTSNACTKYKNLYGMTKATVRPSTQSDQNWSGEYQNNTGAMYSTYFDSVYDLKLWLSQHSNYKDFTYRQSGWQGFTVYCTWLKDVGYYTAPYETYQQGAGYYLQKQSTGQKYINILTILVTVGVALSVIYYVIRLIKKKKKPKSGM